MNVFYGCFLLLSYFVLIKSDEAAVEDAKIKMRSCLRLATIMIKEDKDYLPLVDKSFYPKEIRKETTFDDLYEGIKHRVIMTCYTEISAIKSAELKNLNEKAINPFTKENKNLLFPETFHKKYTVDDSDSKDVNDKKQERFFKDASKMTDIYNTISEEFGVFDSLVATYLDKTTNTKQKEGSNYISKSKHYHYEEQRKQQQQQQEHSSGEYLDDFEYSNLNLSIAGYDLTSPKVKNSVGLVLFALMIAFFVYAYKTVTKKEEKDKKKKDKKKKE